MSAEHATSADTAVDSRGINGRSHRVAAGTPETRRVRVLLYSDDSSTRDAVRVGVGRRPARDVEVCEWTECAGPDAVRAAAEAGGIDVFVLDGEAVPYGGLGLCRELKHSVYECPPVVVLTGRPQDGWLASWSYADHAVSHPLDPVLLAAAVADAARSGRPTAVFAR